MINHANSRFTRESVEFVWANDHQNREAVLSWDYIPPSIPRVGERIWLDGAKNVSLNDEKPYSYDMAIVAEVEWSVHSDKFNGPNSCCITFVLRDPTPDEWANGRWKLYPEYEYSSDGTYVIKESTGDMRICKEPDEVITDA